MKMVDFLKKEIILKIFLFVVGAFITIVGFNIYQNIHLESTRVEVITKIFRQSLMTFEENLDYINSDFNNIIKDFYHDFQSDQGKEKIFIGKMPLEKDAFKIDYYFLNKNKKIIDSNNKERIGKEYQNDFLFNSLSLSSENIFITDFLLNVQSHELVKYLISKNNGEINIFELKIPDNLIKNIFTRLSESILNDNFNITSSSSFVIDNEKNIHKVYGDYNDDLNSILDEIMISQENFISNYSFNEKKVYYIYEMKDNLYRPIKYVIKFSINNSFIFTNIIVSASFLVVFIILFFIFMKNLTKKSKKVFIDPIKTIIESNNRFDLDNPDKSKIEKIDQKLKINEIEILRENNLMFQKTIKEYFHEVKKSYSDLEDAYATIEEKNQDMKNTYLNFAQKLSLIAEGHDEITGKHIYRVGEISAFVAKKLGKDEKFIEDIRNFAPLHDIGKIFIPLSILKKEKKLTEEEWEIMKNHTILADKLLDGEYFNLARNIALYHHEKHDGTGYPYGLKDKEIPLEAQIVQLADIFDALRSERTYKKGFTIEKTYDIIINGDGRVEPSHFYPEILEVFKKYYKEIDKIFLAMQD